MTACCLFLFLGFLPSPLVTRWFSRDNAKLGPDVN